MNNRLGGQGLILDETKDFSLVLGVQTNSEAHPTYYPTCTGGSFHGYKTAGA
jgi:hypothetical protein